jgi:uncharacterized RDD family membrane protein YckC
VSPGGYRLAEFSDRFLARLIDALILGGVSLVVILPLYAVFFFSFFNSFPSTVTVNGSRVSPEINPFSIFLPFIGLFFAMIALTWLLGYIYEVEMMFRSGQTFGKRAMKIRVIPVDPTQTLTRVQAGKRFLVDYVAGGLVPGLRWLDGLWQLWDKPYRQCLHDKWAQTLVIKL